MELINEISWGPDELTNCPGVVGRAELKDPLLGVAIPLGELKAAAAAAANDDDDFEEFKYKFIDDEDNDGDIELALLEAEAPDVDVDDRTRDIASQSAGSQRQIVCSYFSSSVRHAFD